MFLIIFIYPFTDHKVSLPASGCVGMAGQQGDKFLPELDQDLLNFVWLNNLDFGHPILERFPEVRNDDLVAGLQLIHIPEVRGATPSPMAGNDTICVLSSDGDTGLT